MALSLCSNTVANVGELACDVSKGVLKKVFIFNGEIASSDYATGDALLTRLIANSKLSKTAANKVFPINEAQEIADSSEANKEGSLGLGFKAILLEGKPAYKVKIFAGADLLKRLRKFNNQTVRIFEYDANGTIWGTKNGTKFIGYKAKLFFTGGKIATGQNVEEGVVEFTLSILSTSEYLDNSYYAEMSGNIESVVGLNDVTMSNASNVTNVYKVKLKIPGSSLTGDYDIADDYGAAIASLHATAPFTAKSGVTYATTLPITSVAYDATLKALTVTYDSATFTALAAATPIKLTGPTPAQLDAADITAIELLDLAFVK